MEGTIVSHYRILEPLGRGGMGVVYKAEDTRLGRLVALKFLPLEFTIARDDARARFIQEARATSALDHPNICTIHEVDESADGRLFLAMTLYEGETLRQQIDRQPLTVPQALDFTGQIAQGLVKAHEVGIVHRDIKPQNVMVTRDGLVKILDFGLAKLTGDQTALTAVGTTMGTLSYMSPEQLAGAAVDERTDIWSLAAVMYEMLTGQLPFRGEAMAMSVAIRQARPVPITALRSGIPIELERIVLRALEKTPDDRYQTMKDMLSDVRRVKRDSAAVSEQLLVRPGVASGAPRFRADTEESDDIEYHEAIKAATDRIWISQTWFPGIDRDAAEIVQRELPDVRVLLASFKEPSPVFARIQGRKLKLSRAKANVESCVRLFVEHGRKDSLRFCYGHHPGWIAVIDDWVFWGPTPVHRDNHSIDFLFHKHPVQGAKGRFWVEQFEMLWENFSHDYEAEKPYNDELIET